MLKISMEIKRMYPAQAVIIAMIVIVVAAIVGVAVVSRMQRDTSSTELEQLSSESLELSDSVISLYTLVDSDNLFTSMKANEVSFDGTYTTELNGVDELSKFFTSYLGKDISGSLATLFDGCDSENSDIKVTLSLTNSEAIELPGSTTMGFVIGDTDISTIKSSCALKLEFDPLTLSSVGLMVQKVYSRVNANGLKEYKNYNYTDTSEYCVVKSGSTCDDGKYVGSTWTQLQVSSGTNKNASAGLSPILLTENVEGYRLDEIRITPLGGTLKVWSSLSESGCAGLFDLYYVKVSVTATCNGVSRGKEVLIPRKNNTSYSSMFDYSVYNAEGTFELFEVGK